MDVDYIWLKLYIFRIVYEDCSSPVHWDDFVMVNLIPSESAHAEQHSKKTDKEALYDYYVKVLYFHSDRTIVILFTDTFVLFLFSLLIIHFV